MTTALLTGGSGFDARGGRTSAACAAIDQRSPDALDFDGPLEFDDVVLAHFRRCRLLARFARRDPALGDGIVPLAQINQLVSPLFDPPCVIARPTRPLPVFCVLFGAGCARPCHRLRPGRCLDGEPTRGRRATFQRRARSGICEENPGASASARSDHRTKIRRSSSAPRACGGLLTPSPAILRHPRPRAAGPTCGTS